MKNSVIFPLIFSFLLVSGCDKPNADAYKLDPIFQDYQQQLAATNSDLEGLKKQAEASKKDLSTSKAQSGQAAIHRKKLNELLNKIAAREQQVRFWKIRIESQAKASQKEYLQARSEGRPWPDQKKTEAYMTQKRLRQAKMVWDQKDRIKEYEESSKPKPPPSSH